MSRKPSTLAMILAASLCLTNLSPALALAAESEMSVETRAEEENAAQEAIVESDIEEENIDSAENEEPAKADREGATSQESAFTVDVEDTTEQSGAEYTDSQFSEPKTEETGVTDENGASDAATETGVSGETTEAAGEAASGEPAEPAATEASPSTTEENLNENLPIEGIAPDQAEGQSVIPGETDGQSPDDLFSSYVDSAFGSDSAFGTGSAPGTDNTAASKPSLKKRGTRSAGASLYGVDAAIYSKIAGYLPAIAAGERASTAFEIAADELGLDKTYWTAAELGVGSVFEMDESGGYVTDENGYGILADDAIAAVNAMTEYDLNRIISALLADYPYQLYWYEKTLSTSTTGISIAGWYDETAEDYVLGIVEGITVSFPVADEFAAGRYTVDTSVGQSVRTAVENANAIVSKYSSSPDYDKLYGYMEEICDLVSYNYEAADGNVSYGNPWQMVWVFDDDPDTNVVCEGYSKAFKYLCDQSDFSGDISCITVTGTMTGGTGEGPHMWNVVNMEDGINYLVDVTNCDEGTIGEPDELFLAGCYAGSVDEGYTYNCKDGNVSYTYDSDTLQLYYDLAMSDTGYAVKGYAYTEGDLEYEICGNSATIVGYVGSPTEIIIPESVNGASVIAIKEGAFRECETLVSVTIPRTLKRMEGSASYSTFFDYPDTTDQIETFGGIIGGNSAFYCCSNLTKFTIPEDSQLEYIGPCTFLGTGIKNIDLPETVAYIGAGAFFGCDSLASITIPGRVESIEPFAIADCDNLRTVTIESGVLKKIGLMAFSGSFRITSFVIPESVERIDELAFYWCTQLHSITIPQNVSSIDPTSFVDCLYLESINVDDANDYYASIDGVLYDKEISRVVCCPGNKSGHWVLPDSVTTIEPFSCFGSQHVTEITLPQSLETIGLAAFANCFVLEKINIPSKVTELPEKMFLNCSNLSEIKYEGTISEIGDYCFCGCGFTGVDGVWPENLHTIVRGAFRANNIKTLEIPSHVTIIEEDAFSNNGLLADVSISEELLSAIDVESVFWNTLYLGFSGQVGNNATYLRKGHKLTLSGSGPTYDYTFDPPTGGEEVEEVEIEEGITTLGTRVMGKKYDIESIIIPASVQHINEDCFEGTWFNELTILCPICIIDCELNCQVLYGYDQSTAETYANEHESVTFISLGEAPHVDPIEDNVSASGSCGENAYWNLENNVLTISGSGAMYDWANSSGTPWFDYRVYIKSVVVQEGITYIGKNAFRECTSAKEVTLNEGLLGIGECAFMECSKLGTIIVPQSVTEIGSAAFSMDTNLSSIILPDQLTCIADNLFTSCENLSEITIPESVTSIGDWAFNSCYNLKEISLPDNIEEIEEFAFSSTSIESISIPDSVTVIDECVFLGCDSLSSIIIPDSIAHIYRQAFYGCRNLSTIVFEGDMPDISPSEVFGEVTAAIYYPGDNDTWAVETLDTYNGNIEWKPYNNVAGAIGACMQYGHNDSCEILDPATCTEAGTMKRTCRTCGRIVTEEIPATGHKWYEWTNVLREPTVDEDGLEERFCQNDESHFEERPIPSLSHVHEMVKTEAVAAKCSESGNTEYWTCSKCGRSYSDSEGTNEITIESTITPAIGHIWDIEHSVVREATCTEAGSWIIDCSVCGEEVVEEIPAKGHRWGKDYTVDKIATCTEEGSESIHCSDCGEIKEGSTRVIEKIGHSYGEEVIVKPATCTEAGSRKKVCTVCGDEVTEEIHATGHTWNEEYTVDSEPTCTEEGSESIHCSVCGEIKEGSIQAIEMLDHTYGEWETVEPATCTETGSRKKICTVCGDEVTEEIPATGHAWGEWTVVREATEEEEGLEARTCSNDSSHSEERSIPKLDHVHNLVKTEDKPATCTGAGNIMYWTCSKCGKHYLDGNGAKETTLEETVIASTGHIWDKEYTVDNEPTCIEEGSESIHCATCGEIKEGSARAIEKLTHTYGEWETVRPATCTEAGSRKKVCTFCGDEVTEEIPATGHAWGEWTVVREATEEEEGLEARTCSNDPGHSEERSIPKLEHAHKFVKTEYRDPTCTESGNIEYWTCNKCGKHYLDGNGAEETTLEETVIPATGHTWNEEYTVDNEPTCTEEGAESIYCSVCGVIKEGSTQAIEMLEHSYGEWETVKETTCTVAGSRKKVCTMCGNEVTEEIPAIGHMWATKYTVDKEPTNTADGSKSIHCTVCDAVKEGSEILIPRLAKDLNGLTITGIANKTYTGKAVTQEPVIKDGNKKLVQVTDYTLSYKNNINTGTATVIIQGKGSYTGTVTQTFMILPGKTTRGDMFNLANNVKVTWKEVPGAKYYKVYRSGVKDPVIVTTGLVGWDKSPGLVNGQKYTYKIVASLTGKGDSSGDSSLSYSKVMYRLKTVAIRSVKNTAPGKVTVKYDKSTSGDSYVLQYSERQDMVGAKTKVVMGANTTSYVIGGLKKGKTYYISIRVRKKVNGIDYYTTFGVAKKVKITQ